MDNTKFVTKAEILDSISAFKDAERQKAITKMEGEIASALEKALKSAQELGYVEPLGSFDIPEFFRDPNGQYSFPEEVQQALQDAGYSVQKVWDSKYTIFIN